uniref:Secreted protein n=1 Tax=Meloidogyne incognita TaxID=6306 RepID=A0A914KS66_MELIC
MTELLFGFNYWIRLFGFILFGFGKQTSINYKTFGTKTSTFCFWDFFLAFSLLSRRKCVHRLSTVYSPAVFCLIECSTTICALSVQLR